MFQSADSYDRFMGRYSEPLAKEFADFAGIQEGQEVLDVGSGPGALTGELVRRLGIDSVSAVDPSEPFITSLTARHPGVATSVASAEDLPHPDDSFDVSLAQLVVHFMSDPVAGLSEMRRVTRPGGVVTACVWDLAGGGSPLSPFWDSARELDPEVSGEGEWPGTRQGHLGELFSAAGLVDIEETALIVELEHPTFDDWWDPFTMAVGPAGAYVSGLDPTTRGELRERCRARFPDAPFLVAGKAWAARGDA